jgi:hypothetical protein
MGGGRDADSSPSLRTTLTDKQEWIKGVQLTTAKKKERRLQLLRLCP